MRNVIACLVAIAFAASLLPRRGAEAQTPDPAAASETVYGELVRFCAMPPPKSDGYPAMAMTPVTLRVFQNIVPVPATDGFVHLAYAAQVTSALTTKATIGAFTPVDPLTGFKPTGTNSVVSADGVPITGEVRLFNRNLLDGPFPEKATDFKVIPGGSSGTTFFDVRYTKVAALPRLLAHTIVITAGDQTLTAPTNPIVIDCRPPVVLDPPLVGSGWWDGNGCCKAIAPHRGATLPMNGDFHVPEAFAIDYVQLNAHNGCCNGPVDKNESWQFFRAPILAATDGTVVELENNLPEQIPGEPKNVTLANVSGNHIIEDIGNGRYILYGHLHTGSIPSTIKLGTHLETGERIGELGNSGNSTGPHLHFQVMDRPSALDATAQPFVFRTQKLEGTVIGTANATDKAFEGGESVEVDRSTTGWKTLLMPAETQVFGYNLNTGLRRPGQ